MSRYETAAQAIQQAGLEVGLTIPTNPYASTDQAVIQLCGLLTSCGREINLMREWQRLVVKYSLTTQVGDTGDYPLPSDYGRHIDQTDWNPTNRLPLGGPLSAQDWTYLINTNLASSTIYISFRESQGLFRILPQPPPKNQVINFEYLSRWWVALSGTPLVLAKDFCSLPDDVILYDPLIIQKLLKLRFLEAKKFDTSAAAKQFDNSLMTLGGADKASPILSVSRSRGFPYLDDRNIPETKYGIP